jgi:hypothetical protein
MKGLKSYTEKTLEKMAIVGFLGILAFSGEHIYQEITKIKQGCLFCEEPTFSKDTIENMRPVYTDYLVHK